MNSELLPLVGSLAYESGDTASRFFCSGISSSLSVNAAWVSSPWRLIQPAASATRAPALPSWSSTAAAVADTRSTATTTASALSRPSFFRLRNFPIVSLSSWATFCKFRLASSGLRWRAPRPLLRTSDSVIRPVVGRSLGGWLFGLGVRSCPGKLKLHPARTPIIAPSHHLTSPNTPFNLWPIRRRAYWYFTQT